mmetsp:Transcript_25365/g.49492  ORF Transcript_25365/g.49492 Transcript_25365/m.49492 type:complete len:529 (+) Transcript_25365:932-2518(+)
MHGIVSIEHSRRGRTLRRAPKRRASRRDHVEGEVEEQLLDLVVKELFEPEASPNNTVAEGCGLLGHQVLFERLQCGQGGAGLLLEGSEVVGHREVRVDVILRLLEDTLKVITRPLDGVFDGVWEVLEGADGDGLLGRVAARSVRFSHLGDYHLHVPLGAKCPALQQRTLVVDASLIHVQPCLNVIERVTDTIQTLEKIIIEQVFRVRPDPRAVTLDVERRVHPGHSIGSGGCFEFLNVGGAEQELPVEVALLDCVHVCEVHTAPWAAPETHQCPVLQHLASDRARPDQKVLRTHNPLMHILAKHGNLAVIARPLQLVLAGRKLLVWQSLCAVVEKPLLDGRELAGARLEYLLGGNAPKHRSHRGEIPTGVGCHLAEKLLVDVVDHLFALAVELPRDRNHLLAVLRVAREGEVPVLLHERINRLEPKQKLGHAIHLGKVGNGILGISNRVTQRLEIDLDRHLDLLDVPTTLVLAHLGSVGDGEGVGACDFDLHGGAVVELRHTLHFSESNEIARLEAMPDLIQCGDHAG